MARLPDWLVEDYWGLPSVGFPCNVRALSQPGSRTSVSPSRLLRSAPTRLRTPKWPRNVGAISPGRNRAEPTAAWT
eukprot:g7146.t1